VAGESSRLIFAFPGARTAAVHAVAALYGAHPVFTVEMDELADALGRPDMAASLSQGGAVAGDPIAAFAVELALARVWRHWGVRPDAVVAERIGRLAAAVVAGALSADTALAALTGDPDARATTLADTDVPVHWAGTPKTAADLLNDAEDGSLDDVIAGLPDGDARDTVLVMGAASDDESGDGRAVRLPSVRSSGEDAHEALLTTLARLWVAGHAVDWRAVDEGRPVTRVAMPGYPYQRERYWIDRPEQVAGSGPDTPRTPGIADDPSGSAETAAPAVGPARSRTNISDETVVSWVGWREEPRAYVSDRTADIAVLLPAGDAPEVDLVISAVRAICADPVLLEWPSSEDGGDSLVSQLRKLAESGRTPDLLVHAVAVGRWDDPTVGNLDDQVRASFSSLFTLAQQAPRALVRTPEIAVVASHSLDVSGGERVDRIKAALHGLSLTLRRELAGDRCRFIDIGARVTSAELATEIRSGGQDSLVALRGTRRWVRCEHPLAPGARAAALRSNGRYLITGGLGGLGLVLADRLARTGLRPRLVLMQRRASGARAEVEEIRALGAEVEIMECDVSDAGRLGPTIADLVRRGGPFHGLFHLAGTPGDGMVQFRDHADAIAVLRPKVHGMIALEEALDGQPELDFAILFSSRSGVHGAVGSGDYAAANSFLDCTAAHGRLRARRVLSVAWPAWAGVGMAARSKVGLDAIVTGDMTRRRRPAAVAPDAAVVEWTTSVSPADDWFLDEHRLGTMPVAPGSALVELIVRAARERSLVSGPVAVHDVNFRSPLFCGERCDVRIEFAAEGPAWSVRLSSREAGDDDAGWVRCVTARVAAASMPVPEGVTDPAGLEKSGPAIERPPLRGRTNGLRFGPRWDVVVTAWLGDDVRLAHLRLPTAFTDDLEHHELHPALLDIATGMICMGRPEGFVPAGYRTLECLHPLPAEVYAHARMRPRRGDRTLTADIDIYAPEGTLVTRIAEFTMVVPSSGLSPEVPVATGDDAIPGDPAAPGAPGREPPGAEAGTVPSVPALEPADGMRIVFDLLERPTPPHVIVSASGTAVNPPEPVSGRPDVPPAQDDSIEVSTDDVLDRVCRIWASVLGLPRIEPDANFFDIDGDSLSAVEVLAMVRDAFGVELDIAVLIDAPTVRDFAELIVEARTGS
jgi:phthiocerol/phenolphthiocerol synthesis type-I polyketide synthase E